MKYFTIEELTRSATAERRGIVNTPDAKIIESLTLLTVKLLDPLRELWGAPLRVTSGYRSPELNRAVGGVVNSHHMRGMAADLVTMGNTEVGVRRLMERIVTSELQWTQAILEHNRRGATWVHVSYDPANLKREVLYR